MIKKLKKIWHRFCRVFERKGKRRKGNVYVRLVNGLYEPCQAISGVFPWETGPLTLLESITKVPDRQVTKTGKSSIF